MLTHGSLTAQLSPRFLPQREAKQWQSCLPSPGIWCQRTNVKDSRKKLRAGVWWSHSWLRRVVQHPTQLFQFYRILQVPTKEEIFFPGDIVWSFFLYFKKIYETLFFFQKAQSLFLWRILFLSLFVVVSTAEMKWCHCYPLCSQPRVPCRLVRIDGWKTALAN